MTQKKPYVRTPAQIAEHQAIRERFQRERPTIDDLVARGEADPPIRAVEYWNFIDVLQTLKAAREAAGISQAQVAERTGMDTAAISRLENGRQFNPTLHTLLRYAAAVGKMVVLQAQDAPPEVRPPKKTKLAKTRR